MTCLGFLCGLKGEQSQVSWFMSCRITAESKEERGMLATCLLFILEICLI